MEKEENYILYGYIASDFSDPISSLLLSDEFVMIGTMLGKIILFSLFTQKQMIINEGNTENITSIKFDENDNVFYTAKGDEEIFQIQIIRRYNKTEIQFLPNIKLHLTDEEHDEKCENTFIILSDNNLLKIQLKPPDEKTLDLNKYKANYEVMNYKKDKLICEGYIIMGNYSIPFDFDGENFIFIEILGENKKNINKVNLMNNFNENIIIPIDNKFGHISYIKFINNSSIIFVHSLNVCEIRKLNKEFTLIESFIHKGDEVYDIYLYQYNTKIEIISEELSECDKNNHRMGSEIIGYQLDINNHKKVTKSPFFVTCLKKIKDNSYSIGTGVPYNVSINKLSKKEFDNKNNNKNTNLAIITLDIDGNVNCYENKEEKTLFNLYNIKDISQDIKNKSFFSMGYQYFIQINSNFFCISTDFGCFIIKKKN